MALKRTTAVTEKLTPGTALGVPMGVPNVRDVQPPNFEYWKTHSATTPQQAQEKLAAYNYAVAQGIKGYPYLDFDETRLASGKPYQGDFGERLRNDPQSLIPPDPLGTPFIDDGQSFGTTGLGGAVSGRFGSGSGAPGSQAAGPALNPSGVDPTIAALMAEAQRTRGENLGYIDGTLRPRLDSVNTGYGISSQGRQNVVDQQRQQDQWLQDSYGALYGKASADANAANYNSLAGLQAYGAGLGAAHSSNLGHYDQLASTYGGMSQMSATPQFANQQAVLAQQTLAQYQTAKLYQAALERAQQNPQDVQAQRDVLALSRQISEGSLDIVNGGLTPEAKKSQLEALSRYGELSAGPEVTGQERFIYETARNEQERQEKASRDALMNEYRARGAGNSGLELAAILQGGQNASQNRLLSDLGAQSTAVQRQMAALQGYRGLSTDMMQQGNDVAQANVMARLQGLGMRGNMANQLAANSQALSQFNAGQANTVGMFNAGQANQNAQFNANAYNQNQMFNAGQANNISMFNAGQTNSVNMNNLNQNMIQTRFADDYRAQQQRDAMTRAQGLADTGIAVNKDYTTNLGNMSTAWQTGVNDAHSRNTGVTNLGAQAATNVANAGRMTNNAQTNVWDQYDSQLRSAAGNDLAVAGLRTGANSSGSAAVTDAIRTQLGEDAARRAEAAIYGQRSNSNPFGLQWNI